MLKYENIPHFCFGCGRIGHAQRECPEVSGTDGGVRFGTMLRCSPQKWNVGRRIVIPAANPKVKMGLNFSGEQKEKVLSGAYSTNTPPARSGQKSHGGTSAEQKTAGKEGVAGASHAGVSPAMLEDLVKGVEGMAVDVKTFEFNGHLNQSRLGKVSGMDSFVDSSGVSGDTKMDVDDNLSMCDRLMKASNDKLNGAAEKKGVKLQGAHYADQLGASPAKRSRMSASQQNTLTGAQDEPRQAS